MKKITQIIALLVIAISVLVTTHNTQKTKHTGRTRAVFAYLFTRSLCRSQKSPTIANQKDTNRKKK